jgi:hypothetical protein
MPDWLGTLATAAAPTAGWFALTFLVKPYLEFWRLRQEVQEELIYLSNVHYPSQETFAEGTDEDYAEEVRRHLDALDRYRRLGARLTALHVSLYWPLRYLLRLRNYDFERAARTLRRYGGEEAWYAGESTITQRCVIERALRLPHEIGRHAEQVLAAHERAVGDQGRPAKAQPR